MTTVDARRRIREELAPLERSVTDEAIGFEPAKLRAVRVWELGVRFAFGFAVSVVAGLVSFGFGDRAGGVLLAFPAILPASLTLIGSKDGECAAEIDAAGATIGAAALAAFAAVSLALLGHTWAVVAEAGAAAAWLAAAVLGYVVVRALLRRREVGTPRRQAS